MRTIDPDQHNELKMKIPTAINTGATGTRNLRLNESVQTNDNNMGHINTSQDHNMGSIDYNPELEKERSKS